MSEHLSDTSPNNLAPSQEVKQTITALHRGLLQAALLPMEVPGVETLRTHSTATWNLQIADFRMRISREDIFNTTFDISGLQSNAFKVTMAHNNNAARFNAQPDDGGLHLNHIDDIPCEIQPKDIEKGKQLLQAILNGAPADHLVQDTHHWIGFRDPETGSTISCKDEITTKNNLMPVVTGVLEIMPNVTGPFELRAKLAAASALEYRYSRRSSESDTLPDDTLTISRLHEVRKFGAGLLQQLHTYNEAYLMKFGKKMP